MGMMDEPPAPSQAHRAASEAERRYWSSVRVAGAFDGKRTLEVKKGAVTSLAVASSGTSVNLAAGTSKGEVVVWRFPSPEEEPGEASDSEEEASAPPPPPKRTSWWGGGGKKAAPASTPKRERRTPKPPAEPFVLARAKCSAHPDQEKEPKSKTAELAPSSLFSAVTSVAWSADASQLCSAERGGTSRMWSLVGDAAEPSAKKTSSKIRMGETLVLSSSHHASSSPLPDEKPPPPPERCLTIEAARALERPTLHRKRRKRSSRRSLKSASGRRRRRGRRASRRGNSGRATRRRCLRFSRRTPSPVANPSRCSRVPTVTSSAPRPPPDPRPSATRRAPRRRGKCSASWRCFAAPRRGPGGRRSPRWSANDDSPTRTRRARRTTRVTSTSTMTSSPARPRSCPRGDWITPRIEAAGIRRGLDATPPTATGKIGNKSGARRSWRERTFCCPWRRITGPARGDTWRGPSDARWYPPRPIRSTREDAEGRRGAARRVRPRPLPRPLVSRRVSGRAPGLGESALGGCRGDDVLVARVSGRPRAVWVWMVLPARVVETPGGGDGADAGGDARPRHRRRRLVPVALAVARVASEGTKGGGRGAERSRVDGTRRARRSRGGRFDPSAELRGAARARARQASAEDSRRRPGRGVGGGEVETRGTEVGRARHPGSRPGRGEDDDRDSRGGDAGLLRQSVRRAGEVGGEASPAARHRASRRSRGGGVHRQRRRRARSHRHSTRQRIVRGGGKGWRGGRGTGRRAVLHRALLLPRRHATHRAPRRHAQSLRASQGTRRGC